MHVYEVTRGIYKIFSWIASLKTNRHGYFSKHQNETGYFCGMTLCNYQQIFAILCFGNIILSVWKTKISQLSPWFQFVVSLKSLVWVKRKLHLCFWTTRVTYVIWHEGRYFSPKIPLSSLKKSAIDSTC